MKALATALFAIFAISSTAQAQYYTSATTCAGYTTCVDYYGNPIGQVSCQVYGAQFVQGYGVAASNNCNWSVMPYVGVECSGYSQVVNQYTGQMVWAWQTYTARCPGR